MKFWGHNVLYKQLNYKLNLGTREQFFEKSMVILKNYIFFYVLIIPARF